MTPLDLPAMKSEPRCDCHHDVGLHMRFQALLARVEQLEAAMREIVEGVRYKYGESWAGEIARRALEGA